jgi:hypothetical protein
MQLAQLSDDDLFSRAKALCDEGNRLLARLIVHLIEIEERRLHERRACSSMYVFCCTKLGMSESAAQRRAVAAQLVRRFPSLLGAIERGELHLSNLLLLRDHLRADNVDELVAAVAGKSARQVEVMLARRAPRPDVPAKVERVAAVPTMLAFEPPAATPPPRRPRVAPLSEERYAIQLTIGREALAKLERARDLMMHANPTGDLAVVVERALEALVEKLEKQRLAKTTKPQKTKRACKKGHVAASVRREVFARDGERCTYVDEQTGERCAECGRLQLDHIVPKARGGTDDASNLRVRCRAHNGLWAEECFGKEHVAASIDLRRRRWDERAADLARRGLVNLGFAAKEVSRALDVVSTRHANDDLPLRTAEIIREALGVLT